MIIRFQKHSWYFCCITSVETLGQQVHLILYYLESQSGVKSNKRTHSASYLQI